MGALGWPEGAQAEARRAQPPPSLCTPASPPAPPASSPAAAGPSLGTPGPVQPVVGLCAGTRSLQPGVAGAGPPAPGAAGHGPAPALLSGPGENPRHLSAHPGLGCAEARGVQVAPLPSVAVQAPSWTGRWAWGFVHTFNLWALSGLESRPQASKARLASVLMVSSSPLGWTVGPTGITS